MNENEKDFRDCICSSFSFNLHGDNSHCYPSELDFLKGRKLCLKIEKSNIDGYYISEKPFRVERICQDLSLIDVFDSPFLNEATDSEDDE
ncbi:hypothetical protein P8452_03124 [Trifolium repens]|nr:hypothetical protein P8452_03124 [Trifolium repens]